MAATFKESGPQLQAMNVTAAEIGKGFSLQKIIVLTLEQIAEGISPENNLVVGWRYVASVTSDIAIAIQLSQDSHGKMSFAGITAGKEIADSLQAAQELRARPPDLLGDDTYEVDILRIPALYTDCLFLRSQTNSRNHWILPYNTVAFPPNPPEDRQKKKPLLLAPAWLDRFRKPAQDRLASKNGPESIYNGSDGGSQSRVGRS